MAHRWQYRILRPEGQPGKDQGLPHRTGRDRKCTATLLTGIEAAVVLAKATSAGEKELVAYLVSSQAIEVQELRSSLGKSLPAYMIPTHFVQLDALPLTPNGKVDRKRLPEPEGLGLSSAVEYIAPRNQTEEKLAAIWQEFLAKKK